MFPCSRLTLLPMFPVAQRVTHRLPPHSLLRLPRCAPSSGETGALPVPARFHRADHHVGRGDSPDGLSRSGGGAHGGFPARVPGVSARAHDRDRAAPPPARGRADAGYVVIATPRFGRATDAHAATASPSRCASTAVTARDGTASAVIDASRNPCTVHQSDRQAPRIARPASPRTASTTSPAIQYP